MDIKKIILYCVIGLLGLALYNAWLRDYPSVSVTPAVSEHASNESSAYTPGAFNPQTSSKPAQTGGAQWSPSPSSIPENRLINIKTDVFDVDIDTLDGNIVAVKLSQYPVSLEDKKQPIQLLRSDPQQLYDVQANLTDVSKPITFSARQKQFILQPGQDQLTVTITGRNDQGLEVNKSYFFRKGRYDIGLTYEVENKGTQTWAGSLYTQITRQKSIEEGQSFYSRSYNGAAMSSPEVPYEKVTYKNLDKADINRTSKDGWIAMQQHYFLTAWIPGNRESLYHYYSHVNSPTSGDSSIYIVGFVSPQMTLNPGDKGVTQATLYVGPEIASQLNRLAPGLDHTIDYGWLWPVSVILFWIMNAVHTIVRNWGWSIIITTIIIKIVFYWFSAKSFRSMARMREIQPRMQALRERYGDDRQALSKATMDLYRQEKINPLGGCLPLVIQIPVFIAFYYVIIESVELRQAPFMGWIHDLSAKDPYYVLPILMGVSMLAQQWLTPTSPDPMQQKMMYILPIVFTVFFINFPAGLVLYWLVNNIVQILQQWYVTKTYEQHKNKLKTKKLKQK